MRPLDLLLPITVVSLLFGPLPYVAGPSKADPPKRKDIGDLITQLGSPKFMDREAAEKDLEEIGYPALEPLYDRLGKSGDAEVRRRAERLIERVLERGSAKHEIRRFQGPRFMARKIVFSKERDKVLSCCSFRPAGKEEILEWSVRLWDLTSGGELQRLKGPVWAFTCGDISPDGRHGLAAGGGDSGPTDKATNDVILWDLQSGNVIKRLVGHKKHVNSAVFSPDGRLALSAGNGKTVKLWDLKSGKVIHTMRGHSMGVRRAVFSPDGWRALSCGDQSVRLWDLKTGREILALRSGAGLVWNVTFSPDGRRALSGSGIGTDPATFRDCTVRLWDLENGKEVKAFVGHEHYVQPLAFSRDGRFAISGSRDQTVRVWDIERGLEIRRFKAEGTVISLALTRDGKAVLGGTLQQNLVQCWPLPD